MSLSTPVAKPSWIPFAVAIVFSAGLLISGGIYLARQSMVDGSLPAVSDANNPVTVELPEKYPRGEKLAPAFNLVNQHGQSVSLAAFKGQPLILTFAFAHCATMCPGVIQTVKSARADLATPKPEVFFITLDPARDKPDTLAETASKWQFAEGMHFLSGAPETVDTILEQYNIPRYTDEKTGEMNHPALVYVVDAEGRLAYSFSNPTKRWVMDAVRRVSDTKIN